MNKTDKDKESLYSHERTRDEVDMIIYQLFVEEPFLGNVAMYLWKKEDNACPTAYVTCKKIGGLLLGYNLDFMSKLKRSHIRGVLLHEVYHLVLMHILGRQPVNPNEWMCWNIACDLVVNWFVAHQKNQEIDPNLVLPSFALYPGKTPENCEDEKLAKLIASFPGNMAAEWYFGKLKEFVENQEKKIPGYNFVGVPTLDDHNAWGDVAELPEEEQQILRQRVENILQDSMDKAMTTNWGSTPASLQKTLEKLLKKEVNWRAIIKMFFGRARTTTYTSTVRRLNRRCPIILPGNKKNTKAKFAFFIDQSGSMSDKNVAVGFSEVSALSGLTEIDVYNFDTEVDVDSHKVWKSGKNHPWGRTRCGGTDFNAVRNFVALPENINRWTGVVIYTDGYASGMAAMPPGVKVLWVITPEGSTNVLDPRDLVVQLTGV